MKRKIDFEKKIIIWAVVITLIPLVLSYGIFIKSKLSDMNDEIKVTLQNVGNSIAQNPMVQDRLAEGKINGSIQNLTKLYIHDIKNVNIIVVADMKGIKYSHLDQKQIGDVFIGQDKANVLKHGDSYFSIMEGSMGETLRWFQPIYKNGKQVGFVMVGKYYDQITLMNNKTKLNYLLLFIGAVSISILISKFFAKKVKKEILNMEPDEIAKLYNEKNIILNSVEEGIIGLDKDNKITEINNSCYKIIENFNEKKFIEKLKKYIENKEDFEMKEFIIQGKRVFVSIKYISQGNYHLGAVITLFDNNNINKIAKEITGVDQIIKNLRANVHEYKNNMHVILGLIHIGEYEEAKKFIMKIQEIQENNTNKFSNIGDYYVRALLLSRELVAKERRVNLVLEEEAFLYSKHGIINSYDIVTILGNLIENAFEAMSTEVFVNLFEDENLVIVEVSDNGKPIKKEIRDKIFKSGVSSKGEGRGTGLNLVKSRVELYNGEIEISEFEDKKIFTITMCKGE
ncbi:ATP-binding protein [Clostridium thermobutyricum]